MAFSVFEYKSGRLAGKWCAQEQLFDKNGKAYYVSGVGATKEEAHERYAVNVYKRKMQERPKAPKRDRKPKRTLEHVLRAWEDANKAKFSYEHLLRTRRRIENHLEHLLGKSLADLTESVIKKEFADLQARLVDTPTAYWNVHKAMRTQFSYAVKQDWIKLNPMRNVDNPKCEPKVRAADEKYVAQRTQVYENLLNWLKAKGSSDYYWMLFMSLGVREGELCGLELDSYDDYDGELTIDRQFKISPKVGIDHGTDDEAGTKNKRGRTFQLPGVHQRALEDWLVIRKGITVAEPWAKNQLFPFQWKNGTWHGRSTNRLRDDFGRIMDEFVNEWSDGSGVIDFGNKEYPWEVLKFRPHYMRHISASYFMHEGITREIAQAILGHLTEAMTAYYTHPRSEDKRNALERTMAHLG